MSAGNERFLDTIYGYGQSVNQARGHHPELEQSHHVRHHSNPTMYHQMPASVWSHMDLLPQKRSMSDARILEPGPGCTHTISLSTLGLAPHLERHSSAPTGRWSLTEAPVFRGLDDGTVTHPMPIPKGVNQSSSRRTSHPARTSGTTILPKIYETQDLSPVTYLNQSAGMLQVATARSLAISQFDCNKLDTSLLTAKPVDYTSSCSPATTSSDSFLTNTSTATSESMTRNNTCDQVYGPLAMFRMDSTRVNYHDEPASIMLPEAPYTASSLSVRFPTISSPMSAVTVEAPISKEIEYPSPTQISFSHSPTSIMRDDNAKKHRILAAKKHEDVITQSDGPRIVAIRDEDGTVRHKAEISRTTRQPQQRKTTFCGHCNEQPQGFHGDHELRRHIERQHTQYRKVWVCRDASTDGTFLANCKACKHKKTYGANYNAAAHLRRAHFNPCKTKRGGRNKKSENRGGMGGGNSPSMEELKKWMYEVYELNYKGRIIIRDIAPDSKGPSAPMLSEDFDTTDDVPIGLGIEHATQDWTRPETMVFDSSYGMGGTCVIPTTATYAMQYEPQTPFYTTMPPQSYTTYNSHSMYAYHGI